MTTSTQAHEEDQETMVLRTVYLPASLDEELKKLAFHGSTSKGALIRKALLKLVDDVAEDARKATVGNEAAEPSTRKPRRNASKLPT